MFDAFLVDRLLILDNKFDQSAFDKGGLPLVGEIRMDNRAIPAACSVITGATVVVEYVTIVFTS